MISYSKHVHSLQLSVLSFIAECLGFAQNARIKYEKAAMKHDKHVRMCRGEMNPKRNLNNTQENRV